MFTLEVHVFPGTENAEIILQIHRDLLSYVMPAGVTELTEADALYAMKHASLKQFLE